ncbi:MAG: hypothetical protein ACXVAN_03830 [Polyangia bacterium]
MCHCRQTDEALALAPGARMRDSRRMQRCMLALLVGATLVASACAPPCGSKDVCAVTGHGGDTEVCDGDHWRTCGPDDGNHGLRISCMTSPTAAVCGPGGWTFENNPTP